MINIVGVTALQELQKVEGFKHAIIAGGFVRDGILGGTFTDIDIFIPFKDNSTFNHYINKALKRDSVPCYYDDSSGRYYFIDEKGDKILIHGTKGIRQEGRDKITGNYLYVYEKSMNLDLGSFKGLRQKKSSVYQGNNYLGHYNCKYVGNIETDIIGYKYSGDPNQFGEALMKEFHYHIDRAYYTGIDTVTTKEFERDHRNNEATLCMLKDVQALPGAMKKFFRLQEKYPHFMWRTTCVQLKEENQDNLKKPKTYDTKAYDYKDFRPDPLFEQRVDNFVGQAWNPVGEIPLGNAQGGVAANPAVDPAQNVGAAQVAAWEAFAPWNDPNRR